LESPVDEHYAAIRTYLEQAGTPIGPNDLLIAAHALALDLTLVTANIREFERVPALNLDNWLLEWCYRMGKSAIIIAALVRIFLLSADVSAACILLS
jgi:hypothetical protein